MRNIAPKDAAALDALELREWLDSLDYVLQSGGPVKVARLLRELTVYARKNGVKLPFTANTPYINTIGADEQALMPGSPDLLLIIFTAEVPDCAAPNATASGAETNTSARRWRRIVSFPLRRGFTIGGWPTARGPLSRQIRRAY